MLVKLSVSGLLLLSLAGASRQRLELENPFVLAGKAARIGPTGSFNYLLPQVELRRLRAAYLSAPPEQGLAGQYWQAMATYASLADDTDTAAYCWRQLVGQATTSSSTPAAPTLLPAEPAILAQTARRQVVMFNEEHTQPRGRWLLGSLLPALYRQGFRYLALEALEAADSTGLRQRGYPVTGSGFYTNEPHFGNLIRRARQLGFRLVAYESKAADREQGQARNLLAATLRPFPQVRVLVLAGHAHISEAGAATMAQWVHKLAGIDPLTIEQTQAVVRAPARWQQLPAGAYLVPPASLPGQFIISDLYVFNRLDLAETGNAFGAAAQLTTVHAPSDSLLREQPQQLLVYWQSEKQARPDAEPVAVRCLWSGQSAASFTLLPGTYALEMRDANGRRRWHSVLKVSR